MSAPSEIPSSAGSSAPESDPHASAILRVRQTARSIADRVRRTFLPSGRPFKPLRVLVVDDHPDAAESLAEVLEMLGCPVRACEDGQTALDAATLFEPQVCLLDLMMPRMDGIELAERLRDDAGGRPLLLVAVTALGDDDIRARTALAGFHLHLVKPVDAATLVAVLTDLGRLFHDFGDPTDTS